MLSLACRTLLMERCPTSDEASRAGRVSGVCLCTLYFHPVLRLQCFVPEWPVVVRFCADAVPCPVTQPPARPPVHLLGRER